jgi:hypothetical protein
LSNISKQEKFQTLKKKKKGFNYHSWHKIFCNHFIYTEQTMLIVAYWTIQTSSQIKGLPEDWDIIWTVNLVSIENSSQDW